MSFGKANIGSGALPVFYQQKNGENAREVKAQAPTVLKVSR